MCSYLPLVKTVFAYWCEILACSGHVQVKQRLSGSPLSIAEMWAKLQTHTTVTSKATSMQKTHKLGHSGSIWELCTLILDPSVLHPKFWLKFLCLVLKPTGRTSDCIVVCQQCGHLPQWLLSVSRYTTTCGPTMTKRLLSPWYKFEECTQCGASSGLSETLGKSMGSGSPHLSIPIFVPVPVFILTFLCFPVAPILVYFGSMLSCHYQPSSLIVVYLLFDSCEGSMHTARAGQKIADFCCRFASKAHHKNASQM